MIFEDGQFLNGAEYARMLDGNVLPALGAKRHPLSLCQDNCSIHTCNATREVLDQYKVTLIRLPPLSPDLNWMEKAWANLADRVYEGGRKYANKRALMAALTNAWVAMASDNEYRRRLIVQAETAYKKVMEEAGYLVHWD